MEKIGNSEKKTNLVFLNVNSESPNLHYVFLLSYYFL